MNEVIDAVESQPVDRTAILIADLRKQGYFRCPNNIHSVPGSVWCAGGPGIPEPPDDLSEVYLHEGKISIIKHRFVGVPYKRGHYEQDTLESFDTVAQYIEWCNVNGKLSLPGLPAFSNSWD
jgi:hypothetical protein